MAGHRVGLALAALLALTGAGCGESVDPAPGGASPAPTASASPEESDIRYQLTEDFCTIPAYGLIWPLGTPTDPSPRPRRNMFGENFERSFGIACQQEYQDHAGSRRGLVWVDISTYKSGLGARLAYKMMTSAELPDLKPTPGTLLVGVEQMQHQQDDNSYNILLQDANLFVYIMVLVDDDAVAEVLGTEYPSGLNPLGAAARAFADRLIVQLRSETT